MATKTKTATPATDEAAELARLLDRLTDAAGRIQWGCRVPEPSGPAVLVARERLAALGEKLSDARRRADTLRGEIADAESRARDLDEQADAVLAGGDADATLKSLAGKRSELTELDHVTRVYAKAIDKTRETLRRAIIAESPDAAAAVRPTFAAAVEVLCMAIKVCQRIDPLLSRLRSAFELSGYRVADDTLGNVLVPYELRGTQVERTATGDVVNPTVSALFLEHVRRQGFDV